MHDDGNESVKEDSTRVFPSDGEEGLLISQPLGSRSIPRRIVMHRNKHRGQWRGHLRQQILPLLLH